MATVTTPLAEKAEAIFTDLGYVVERDGRELRAQRKWRIVNVTPADEPVTPRGSGEFQCLVTWQEQATEVRERLQRRDPDYEWAVIGIEENGEYEVCHAPDANVSA
ncbi:DUF7116 family protein [Halorientalis persicus]|jgi:hypothetical protein|nr:hypothetical protein [Halorientalis persicus]